MKLAKKIWILLLACLPALAVAQTNTIAALKQNIVHSNSATAQLRAILLLCDQGYSLHPDTLMFYADRAFVLAKQIGNQRDEVAGMYYMSFALTNKGFIDSSLALANQCANLLHSKIADPVLLANVLNQKGRCYVRKNYYKEAIDMGYQTIAVAEKCANILLQMKGKTLIGWAYLEMEQPKESLQWHLKALHTTTDTSIIKKYGILFANLALNYSAFDKTDSALYCITKAINYSRQTENLFALSNSLAIQAQLLVSSGKEKLAEEPLKEVVAIRKQIGDPFYIASDMGQLSHYYAHSKQPQKGIEIAKAGIAIAQQFKIDTKLFFLYNSLAENYDSAGNKKEYAMTLEKISLLKDSVFEKNAATALAGLQAKYDVQKKEHTIIEQKLQIAQRNYVAAAMLALFAAGIILVFFIYRNYRRREAKKMEVLLKGHKEEAAVALSDAEEAQRVRIATELHNNMGAQISYIASNIDWIVDSPIPLTHQEQSERLAGVHETSRDMMRNLRETIWALNRNEIMLDEFADKLKAYIQIAIRLQPAIQFQAVENLQQNGAFNSLLILNIFRIFQEAVTNAVKHASATQLLLTISCMQNNFSIALSDNGRGFKKPTFFANGSGLQNMTDRANEAGLNLAIQSDPGPGTRIEVTGVMNVADNRKRSKYLLAATR